MPDINITVAHKVAVSDTTTIVCDNSDYMVHWTLDDEWSAYDTKTMRTIYMDGTYTDTVFSGTEVELPVCTVPGAVQIGLFAGDIRTSRVAILRALPSVRSAAGAPADPTPDVYDQIMELINGMGGADPDDIAKAVADYLAAHPIEETDPTVPEWAKAKEKPDYTAAEVGAIAQADLQAATDAALAQAKASGAFDGAAGPQGPAGVPGKDGAGMDITGATVGQIAKIAAVDASGVPTAWSPVDMPSGGGGETWEKIAEIVIPEGADESTALTISQDFDGNPFSLVKARLCAKFPKYTGATSIPGFSFAMLNGKTSGRVTPLAYTSVWPKVSISNVTGAVYEIDVSGAQQIEHVILSKDSGWSDDTSHDYVSYGSTSDVEFTLLADTLWAKPITSIGGTNMLIYPGCRFVLYGVRS